MAAWCRRSRHAPMSRRSTGSSSRRWRGIDLGRGRRHRGDGGSGTDRWRDGGPDHRQGAGAGDRQAAHRVNHLEAHALTARLTDGAEFPFLLLLISGGHCQLLAVEGVGRFRLYGTTIDDAVGEAFDKTAKLMGLPYPGGPNVEAGAHGEIPAASPSAADAGARRRRLLVLRAEDGGAPDRARSDGFTPSARADLAASFQAAILDVLVARTRSALTRFRAEFPQEGALVVAGGVAANGAIRGALTALCEVEGLSIKIPPPGLCTDNAAMVAWAGVERSQLGLFDELEVAPKARWPLQDAPVGGSQRIGASGKSL
jgi:N6-L-threonylcarbamoyladenine synthase